MKRLVAVALTILVGTALATNLIDATRPAEPSATTATAATITAAAAPTTTQQVEAPQSPAAPNTTATQPGLALADVASHAEDTDCWLAISGFAYDVTAYLNDHPGGSRTILPWCGKEATSAFATEDGRGEHSPDAYTLLADYVLGPLTG